VAHLAAGLDLRADHEAGGIDERDDRQAVRVAELHEAGGLVRGIGVDRAAEMGRIAGEDADRAALDPREHRDDAGAEAGAQLERRADVDDRLDDRAHRVDAQPVRRQQLAQRDAVGLLPDPSRPWKNDR
jgi:hypothetical protein